MDNAITTSTTINQTYDFMNVDSFSQLPFVRPPPTTKDNSSSSTGIRLFGVDFSSSSASDSSQSTTTNHHHHETTTNVNGLDNRENNRKFECHYCYRNFPTSQALGGHQNAHKRERQNAKRAHFHSTVMPADGPHHLYSLINHPSYPNYNNINTYSYPNRYSYTPTTTTTNTTSTTYSLYRHHHGNHQYRPTLTGNPMNVWQIGQGRHGVHRNHSNNLPLFVGSSPATIENFGRKFGGNVSTLSSSESQVGLEDQYFKQRSTIDPQVSLDLQL